MPYTFSIQRSLVLSLISMFLFQCSAQQRQVKETNVSQPNILLIMTDDQGWFSTGFNGNKEVKTPNSDFLASQGVIFNRFYAASAVCSPTRGSVVTGRNPQRLGITNANQGHLDTSETTLAEVLKQHGYATGHFGKWHLGTLTAIEKDANRGGSGVTHYTIPTEHGYDAFFSTESKVPTYDPMVKPKKFVAGESFNNGWNSRLDKNETEPYGTAYWTAANIKAKGNLEGDDSKLITDHLVNFIKRSKDNKKPFFSTVWFHAPHLPVVTSQEYRDKYPGKTLFEQNYWGAITAMDEQLGRLWSYLEEIGEADNTIIFYCSDNGPESKTPGTAGRFRGEKRSLYEGGVRVPAFVVWKKHLKGGQKVDAPIVTSDYFPTILGLLKIEMPVGREYDGKNVWNLIKSEQTARDKPIGFILNKQRSWVTDTYKLISVDNGKSYELYNLKTDPYEKNNIIRLYPKVAEEFKRNLNAWVERVNKERVAVESGWK